MGSIETEFLIDLSTVTDLVQLVSEITSILETTEINENLALKLGALNLKQSQLLGIKALIEANNLKIGYIMTDSEMTEASAVSLGVVVKTQKVEEEQQIDINFHDVISDHIDNLNDTFATVNEQESVTDAVNNEDNINSIDSSEKQTNEILNNPEVQAVLDKTLGIEKQSVDNIVEKSNDRFQQKNKVNYEETVTNEKSSEGKYVLLDTEGITPEDMEETSDNTADMPTLYLYQTLRSGQTVSYQGNIFIVGDTHPGSEVIATGDITVWGIIGGIVHAGSEGNVSAKVRALKLNPIQLRIAGLYSRRNDTVNVPYIQRTNEFTPEEARINNKQIVVYKTLRRED